MLKDLALDHLVFAVPDLAAGIEAAAERFGVRPTRGGQHVGFGTANALLALGPTCYLEIIGPDLDQPPPERPRPFGLDTLTTPRLVTFAVKERNLEERVAAAQTAGFDPGEIVAMSRAKPDGSLLQWRLTMPAMRSRGEMAGDGLVPFMIDWGEAPPVAQSVAQGCELVALRAEHPQPEAIQQMLDALGVPLEVALGSVPTLIATLETPNGRLTLR